MQIVRGRGNIRSSQFGSVYQTQLREQFLHDLLTITGDTRVLWLPKATETTTSLDESLNAATLTYDATIAARLSALGLGNAVSFNGSTQYATQPDAAGLSFGNATTDSAFSIVAVANITDTANARAFYAKNGEYSFSLDATDHLLVQLVDVSVPAVPFRTQNSATTRQGAWAMYSFTYSKATGGATAANDIAIYENGLVVASTATNVGTYVAMENGASVGTLGALNGGASVWMQGSMALVAVCQKSLTASDHWAIKRLVNAYFGLSL